ncbi:hypothetical protein B0T17DRAFT_593489 [Bombardia bombarda]|uniref:EKC/KEOPS complex subunit BUD32 n=1 Tax=Bombardia bombarda TaxID=252184 RepID=A0AA39WD15_9PEZI|nr:hypothetical protein B0T17DRAFT_593489 [Bombardia bombarda]
MVQPRTVEEFESLIRQAKQRFDEAKKDRQEAEKRRQEAEKSRQEERQRADKERQRADEERQHTNEQRQLVDEERQRADKERQRADEERQHTNEQRQLVDEERQRADKERQRADEAKEQTQLTTLPEFIAACHDLVFSKFAVETDKRLTSKGGITSPRDKWCPTHLKPWSDFLEQQKSIFGILFAMFPAQHRAFESRSFLAGLGNRVSQQSIADEKTLEHFLHNCVEYPVRAIIDQLKQVEEVSDAFDLGNGVIFENHSHAISDGAEEVIAQENPPAPPQTPARTRDLNQLRPDQISPHKLTAPHLRLGLRAMNILRDVVNRETIPTSVDPDALFQYHADRLTASAITQTYHYMIEGGLEYGLLTTGEAIVFLRVDWKEPETLYYHLAEPGPEALAHPNHFHVCTAVGQNLAFSLMALGPPGERQIHGQEERDQATLHLSKWAVDFERAHESIPVEERKPPNNSPAYRPTTYEGVDRSPYPMRLTKSRLARMDQAEKEARSRKDPSDDSEDELALSPPDTPSPAERRARGGGQGARRNQGGNSAQQPSGGGKQQNRKYCTQKCLLGLVRGGFLDPECPNVALHRKQDGHDGDRNRTRARTRHPVNHAEWLQLLWKQLKQSLDDGIISLQMGGARGVLFEVTMLMYGYTFVSKGTVKAFIPALQHEAAVYERLGPIQGVHVPVFLGAIDLRSMNKIYYYDHRVYVVYMMFLSWGGQSIDPETVDGERRLLEEKALRSLQAMHQEGVVHKDVRVLNMLFNSETDGVMMIDFERALLLPKPRLPLGQLGQLVPNKRAREQETDVKKVTADAQSLGFPEDIRRAKGVFLVRKMR